MQQKRLKPYVASLSQANQQWLQEQAATYKLQDMSKALRMALDYTIQERSEEEVFEANIEEGSKPEEGGDGKQYFLDVSHIAWLDNTSTKRGLRSSALLDHIVTQSQALEADLIFEIDRAGTRIRENSVRFSIKS